MTVRKASPVNDFRINGDREKPWRPQTKYAANKVAPAPPANPGRNGRTQLPGDNTELKDGVRLQKVLSAAGVCSRRRAEELMGQGRVRVNGRVCREPGSRIDPTLDEVRVNGSVIRLNSAKRYFVLNKPRATVSSMHDENGHRDLTFFTSRLDCRVFNVGRLDAETTGILLLTNDGELAHTLAHPSFEVHKSYVAKVRGVPSKNTLKELTEGIPLKDGVTRADSAKLVSGGIPEKRDTALVHITLHSGKNRIVRRMLNAVGHPVIELVRVAFGPLRLRSLPPGEIRELAGDELRQLLTHAADARANARKETP